jgi:hypothetical protein
MGTWSRKPRPFTFFLAFLLVGALITSAGAQGVPAGGGLDLAPSNPTGMPGTTAGLPEGSRSFSLNSCMLRDLLGPTPNFQVGYFHYFGERVDTSRLTLDYVLPVSFGGNSAFFGEAHGEFTNFFKSISALLRSVDETPLDLTTTTTSREGFNDRIDLSFGGGYRRILAERAMVGVNAFSDSARLQKRWYSSGSVGFELASLLPGDDALDLNFNFYGELFNLGLVSDLFRNGPSNFDVELGYSHELGDYGPDLRLNLTGYRFTVGTRVYGWRAGAEIMTRNGMFSVKGELGGDGINGDYGSIGGYVNVGIRLENLAKGESPFSPPDPVFRSPRNLKRLLSQKARRNYWQPVSALVVRSGMASESKLVYDQTTTTVLRYGGVGNHLGVQFPAVTQLTFNNMEPSSIVFVLTFSGVTTNQQSTAQIFYFNVTPTAQSLVEPLPAGNHGIYQSAVDDPGGLYNSGLPINAIAFMFSVPNGPIGVIPGASCRIQIYATY